MPVTDLNRKVRISYPPVSFEGGTADVYGHNRLLSDYRSLADANEKRDWRIYADLAQAYRCPWQVELFFKWIKQHLRIKNFFGTTENAVKTQIWIAMSVYVLVAIIKKRLDLEQSLYTILQILSVTIFEKIPILQVFSNNEYKIEAGVFYNQIEFVPLTTGH